MSGDCTSPATHASVYDPYHRCDSGGYVEPRFTCMVCGDQFEHDALPPQSVKQCACDVPWCSCTGVEVVCADCEEERVSLARWRR